MTGLPIHLLRPDILAAGTTDAEIKSSLHRRELRRLGPGTYVDADAFNRLQAEQQYRVRIRAVAARSKGLVVSHASAVALHELPLLGLDLGCVHLTRPGHGGNRRAAARWVHAGELPLSLRTSVDGVAVTTVARSIVDLARSVAPSIAVVAGDAALHRDMTTADELHEALAFAAQHAGRPRAQRALSLIDGRAESPGESILRLVLHAQGIPLPALQIAVHDDAGRFVGRVDAGYPDDGVLLEFDGRVKYTQLLKPGQTAVDAVMAEKAREERLSELGWLVVRVTWAELHAPRALAQRISAACSARRALVRHHGIRGSAAPMPARTTDWT